MTNVIIILYMGSSISTYLYHHLIIGNYGIIKKRTLKLCKELFLPLTIIWVGFLGVRFEGGGGSKIILCLKPIRIKLETSNLARK